MLQTDEGGGCVRALCGGRDEADGHLLSVFRGRRRVERDVYRRVQPARLGAPVVAWHPRSHGPSSLSLYRVLPTRLLFRRSLRHRNLRH